MRSFLEDSWGVRRPISVLHDRPGPGFARVATEDVAAALESLVPAIRAAADRPADAHARSVILVAI